MQSDRWGQGVARVLVAAAVAAATLGPAPGATQQPSPEQQRASVREQAAAVAGEIDALTAEDTQIEAALAAIQTQVAGQQVVVNQAADTQASADAAVAASAAQIAALEAETDALEASIDRMIVDAFMHPPVDHALDAFRADTVTDASVKDGLVAIQADTDTATINRLGQVTDDLTAEKVAQEALAAEAAEAKARADAALADLDAVRSVQARLAADVEARLDAKQAEARALAATDAALSSRIEAERAALASTLQSSTSTGSAPGGLATVSCPIGGSTTVAGSIAPRVRALLDAAWAAGVGLCGGGYRDPAEQIALRRAHCGTSDYAIYQMPSSQCSPPTARPGSSMHEQGLAIDFTCDGGGTVRSGSSCFRWLSANGAAYGMYNLPSESWHWSTNGQ